MLSLMTLPLFIILFSFNPIFLALVFVITFCFYILSYFFTANNIFFIICLIIFISGLMIVFMLISFYASKFFHNKSLKFPLFILVVASLFFSPFPYSTSSNSLNFPSISTFWFFSFLIISAFFLISFIIFIASISKSSTMRK